MMWQATLRDLQWRRRRFMIAITGTALVFAMSLLMSGLAASFKLETDRTLKQIGADAWIVQAGASGPFTSLSAHPRHDVGTGRRGPRRDEGRVDHLPAPDHR